MSLTQQYYQKSLIHFLVNYWIIKTKRKSVLAGQGFVVRCQSKSSISHIKWQTLSQRCTGHASTLFVLRKSCKSRLLQKQIKLDKIASLTSNQCEINKPLVAKGTDPKPTSGGSQEVNGMAMFVAIYIFVMWNHITKELLLLLTVKFNYQS